MSSCLSEVVPGRHRILRCNSCTRQPVCIYQSHINRRADDTGRDLLSWIRSDRSVRQLTARPMIATVHQGHGPSKFSNSTGPPRNSALSPRTSKSSIRHGDHSIAGGGSCMEVIYRSESERVYRYRQAGLFYRAIDISGYCIW